MLIEWIKITHSKRRKIVYTKNLLTILSESFHLLTFTFNQTWPFFCSQTAFLSSRILVLKFTRLLLPEALNSQHFDTSVIVFVCVCFENVPRVCTVLFMIQIVSRKRFLKTLVILFSGEQPIDLSITIRCYTRTYT